MDTDNQQVQAPAVVTETTSAPEITKMVDEISSGLFPSDPSKAEVEDTPETVAAPAEKPPVEAKVEKPAPAPGPVREPPKTFRPEAQEAFKKADPIIQDEILKREADIFKGIEGYKQNASIGKSVLDVMKPYLPALEKAGINPIHQISGLMNAHYTLSTGTPEQKQNMFKQIAQEYGVYVSPTASGAVDTYVDPQVADLQKQVAELNSKLIHREIRETDSIRTTLQNEIDTFAADPAHIYFDEVANDIAQLLKAGAPTLKDAYERAVWANPQTRAKEQARLQAETDQARQADAKKKAEDARKAAGANVKSKARTGSATAAGARLSSMDDVLAEGLAEIKARH